MIFTNDVHDNDNEDNDDQSQIQEILGLALLQVEQIACGSDSHDGDDVDDDSRGSSCDGCNHGIRGRIHLHILRIHDLDGVQTVNHWVLLRQVTGPTEIDVVMSLV